MTYTNVNEADDNEAERRDIWSNNRVNRREFLRRMAVIGGGAVVGGLLLNGLACGNDTPTSTVVTAPGPGETVSPDDPRIQAGPVEFATAATTMMGYLSRPRDGGPNPAILVIHENRGMQPHFPDVTRRYALQGYTALSVDLLSRKGGTGSFDGSDQAQGRAAGDYTGRFPHRLTRQRGLSPDAFLRHARPDRGYWVLFWWRVDLVDVGAEPGDRGGGSLLWLGPAFGRSPQPERARAGHLWGRRRTDQLGSTRIGGGVAAEREGIPGYHLSWSEPRFFQRHRATLPSGGRNCRLARSPSLV